MYELYRFIIVYKMSLFNISPTIENFFENSEKSVDVKVSKNSDELSDLIKLLFISLNANTVFGKTDQAKIRFDQICKLAELEMDFEGIMANSFTHNEKFMPRLQIYAKELSAQKIDLFENCEFPKFPEVISHNFFLFIKFLKKIIEGDYEFYRKDPEIRGTTPGSLSESTILTENLACMLLNCLMISSGLHEGHTEYYVKTVCDVFLCTHTKYNYYPLA